MLLNLAFITLLIFLLHLASIFLFLIPQLKSVLSSNLLSQFSSSLLHILFHFRIVFFFNFLFLSFLLLSFSNRCNFLPSINSSS
uniref:Candidate secreted effector n=1 Tax=Meloidogyne incognita TaxID=6306 RepID=A0A914KR84_MELIC